MATSESDDFESADEELAHNLTSKTDPEDTRWSGMVVDSESDDDNECIPQLPRKNKSICEKPRLRPFQRDTTRSERTRVTSNDTPSVECIKEEIKKSNNEGTLSCEKQLDVVSSMDMVTETTEIKDTPLEVSAANEENSIEVNSKSTVSSPVEVKQPRPRRSTDGPKKLGARKLGTKVEKEPIVTANVTESVKESTPPKNVILKEPTPPKNVILKEPTPPKNVILNEPTKEDDIVLDKSGSMDVSEDDMPEELKSNKKFKDIFKPQGWEKLGNDIELGEDLTEQKIQPVLDRLCLEDKEPDNSLWGSWGSWDVNSLITTASAGVSTLKTHVSQGLSLLEETINVTDDSGSQETKDTEEKEAVTPEKEEKETNQSQGPFGFGSFFSGVTTITKLVESTGSKVVTGSLDTLEAIGKKTMAVLQEGDPGLKKKRAFFTTEGDKPNLSQILREAKEKAESEEKTLEEKQLARRVHFESLFDDYQGLVHLEALEMLSKQCNIKIQGYLINLDTEDLMSLQETLEEVKQLCDLGDEDEEDKEEDEKDLRRRLANACQDLGITITYSKLEDVWDETRTYLALPMSHTSLEIFQCSASTIAKFTALCVERFHKTAELLLIKERRNTVSEADALVQLTRILTNEISLLATQFGDALSEFIKVSDNADGISANITTIFVEAANASSYVQDAFRLLIPILQVGAL